MLSNTLPDKGNEMHYRTFPRLCNILRIIKVVKMNVFRCKNVIFFLFLLKTRIVGTQYLEIFLR